MIGAGIPASGGRRGSVMNPGRRKPSRKTHIAEMFALNCTELPGAAIDACGAGISLRGISVAAGMTEVKPIMHSALTVEKSTYNGSSR